MDWLVLLPPLLAIVLALWTRQIYLSLFAGLWLGTTLLAEGNPVEGLRLLAEVLVAVFGSASNTRVVLFCILVGGLIALVQVSGGVHGFIAWARRAGWGTSRRRAELTAWGTGMLLFVESNISSLTVGAVNRPLFDTLRLPREKLAYYCDATCAPVCMMIPLNGWGAYVLGLLAAQGRTEGTVALLAEALLYNFFALFAILFALLLAVTGWGFGPMRRAERRADETGAVLAEGAQPMISEEIAALEPVAGAPRQARDLLLPLIAMVTMIFAGLWITGDGNIMEGSGSTAVLWAVGIGIGTAMLLYALPRPLGRAFGSKGTAQPVLSLTESTEWVVKGGAGLLGVTILLVLAFALGQVSRELEMGAYLVSIVKRVGAAWWLPAAVFVVGSFVSFTLGSSWTAFAIMVPIALPLAEGLGLSPPLVLGAVLSGGIFGDHASPLSDTSIISSMAAASDHVDHINTQLPYSLLVGVLALGAFLTAGALT